MDRKSGMFAWVMGGLALFTATIVAPTLFESGRAEAADQNWAGMPQVDIGLVSIGGRATYWDQNNGPDRWFGGAQLRVHPSHYFAIEGSADYRREKFDEGTKTHTYPVQASLLIYPFGTTRVAPFILGGGGWYYTTVDGPGNFEDTQNRFGAHAGGGLQFFLTNHVSFDGTYRYIWLEKLESKGVSLDDKIFDSNGHMITVGLNFHF